MGATIEDLIKKLEEIEREIQDVVKGQVLSAQQVKILSGLSDLDKRLGLIQAGEFRAGNSIDPGKGFSGIRVVYPPAVYNGNEWHLVGVNNDVLQLGINANDGKLYFGGGAGILASDGITIEVGGLFAENTAYKFIDSSGEPAGGLYAFVDDSDNVFIAVRAHGQNGGPFQTATVDAVASNTATARLTADSSLNAGAAAVFRVLQDATGRAEFRDLNRVIFYGKITGGALDSLAEIRTQDEATGATFFRLRETENTPTDPGSLDSFHLYIKGDKFIIQFNDGGTVRYKYLDLTGTGVTWTHTTTAP